MMAAIATPISPLGKRGRQDHDQLLATPIKNGSHDSPMSSKLSTPMTLPPNPDDLDMLSSPHIPRDCSPAPSTSTSLSTENRKMGNEQSAPAESTAQPPAKRRKLTPQEKLEQAQDKQRKAADREEKKRQKEVKDQQDAQEKQRKQDEKAEAKRQRDADHQRKEGERLAKREVKDAEKQRKEEEQRLKDEAAEKKEKSQMRLASFFTGVKTPAAPLLKRTQSKPTLESPAKPHFISKDEARRKSISVEPGEDHDSVKIKAEPDHEPSEYEREFLPFHLPTHSSLPPAPFSSADNHLRNLQELEDALKGTATLDCTTTAFSSRSHVLRGEAITPIRELMEKIQGDSVTGTDDAEADHNAALKAIRNATTKYLHFSEDVRPPYCGTSTKRIALAQARRLARRPYRRDIQEVHYDYDSEAEWEEPEEGEDLGSEGEEDEDEDDDDDEDGFLDDSMDGPARRLLSTKDLDVQCSGICWQDDKGKSKSFAGETTAFDMSEFELEILLGGAVTSIDPHSTAYWQKSPVKSLAPVAAGQTRLPLGLTAQSTTNKQAALPAASLTKLQKAEKPAKAIRLVGPADIDSFKQAVAGKTQTKAALVPLLHKQFSKYPKDVIAATLSHVASRNTIHKCWFLLEMPTQAAVAES